MNSERFITFANMWKNELNFSTEHALVRKAGGHIIHTEQFVLWGFPVNRKEVLNGPRPAQIRVYKNPDAWFVWACAGDIGRIPDVIPYRLDSIIFARDNGELRAYDYDRLIGKIKSRSNEKLTQTNS